MVISSQPVRAQEDKGNPPCAVYIVCGLFGGVAIGAVTTVIMYKIICGVPNRYTCRKRRPTDKKRKTTQTEMYENVIKLHNTLKSKKYFNYPIIYNLYVYIYLQIRIAKQKGITLYLM